MATEYQRLIASGVPPGVAAQTIYDNLKRNPGPPAENSVQPSTPSQPDKPTVRMAQEPDPNELRTRGRPLNPLSRQRMLCSVVLAQAYMADVRKTLTLRNIRELLAAAYERAGSSPKFPTDNSIQNILSELRRGEVAGFPPVQTEGPIRRNWGGTSQLVVRVYPRSRDQDRQDPRVDLTKIPAWVFE